MYKGSCVTNVIQSELVNQAKSKINNHVALDGILLHIVCKLRFWSVIYMLTKILHSYSNIQFVSHFVYSRCGNWREVLHIVGDSSNGHLHGSTLRNVTDSQFFSIEIVPSYRSSTLCDRVLTCRVVVKTTDYIKTELYTLVQPRSRKNDSMPLSPL